MQQGDVIRAGSWVAVAGAGAGLALVGAAVTGKLGSSTTVEQITPSPVAVPTLAHSTGGLSVQEIFRLDAPGVVRISESSDGTARTTHHSLGSGFVIDKAGHIVTSNRVVSGARALKVSF